MDIKVIIGIATAIALGVLNISLEVNRIMKNRNNGKGNKLPCKSHEIQIGFLERRLSSSENFINKIDDDLKSLTVDLKQKIVELSTKLDMIIQENNKEHADIIRKLDKIYNGR